MNDIVKTSIKDRLIIALEKEGLSKTKAGEMLGVKAQYLSMALSMSQWNKFPETSWDILQKWANSGQGIVEYSEKHGKVLPENHEPKPIISKAIESVPIKVKSKPIWEKEPVKEVIPQPKRLSVGEMIDMLLKEIQN